MEGLEEFDERLYKEENCIMATTPPYAVVTASAAPPIRKRT